MGVLWGNAWYWKNNTPLLEISHGPGCRYGPNIKPESTLHIYSQLAERYDREVVAGEKWFGVKHLRKKLVKHAKGKVLEVAAGTGPNLELYPSGCEVVVTDACPEMLALGKIKWQKHVQKLERDGKDVSSLPKMEFELHDATRLPFPDHSFDTVVQTFGLCTYADPSSVLKEMKRVLKPGGQILLLEHGRSPYGLVSWFLDKNSEEHARRWGCYWNRPVEQIVRDSGLTITELHRAGLGTFSSMVCKPAEQVKPHVHHHMPHPPPATF